MLDSSVVIQIISIIILLAFSAYFSSAETALTTCNKIRMRSLAEEGNKRARLAIDNFVYQVAGYIGRFAAQMNGVDVITFEAGIGENGIAVRKEICDYLGFLGVKIDEEKNNCRGKEIEISTPDSKVKVYVVPTNEELMIARETRDLVSK